MENITFGDYTSTTEDENINFNLVLGIFFDGTKNNKTNTEARKGLIAGKNKDKAAKAVKDYGGDIEDNESYNNDYSNVARLWGNYKKKNAIYIEGVGTNDFEDDETDGYAFGAEETGIKAKAKSGCTTMAEKIKAAKDANPAGNLVTLTLDVFGFSRGAAAARNFVHEVSKSIIRNDPNSKKYGLLGTELGKIGINGDKLNIKIRFLGLFDTVSSYSEDTWTTNPNFKNDIIELNLDDITKAQKIVHFVSEDEHREYFDLTNVAYDRVVNGIKKVPVFYGIEKQFPGVHSDIGGGYESGQEKKSKILAGSDTILKERKKQLISEGWFDDSQLFIKNGKLSSDRKLKKTYSFIPLHFMAKYGTDNSLEIDIKQIENVLYKISNDPLLVRVKAKLKFHVMHDGKPFIYKWYHEIHAKYKGAKIPEQRYTDYSRELSEQKDLRALRKGYLHWSAEYKGIGMDPQKSGKRDVH